MSTKTKTNYDGVWEVPAWQLAYDGQFYVSGESIPTVSMIFVLCLEL
jgi:hypothetical protein